MPVSVIYPTEAHPAFCAHIGLFTSVHSDVLDTLCARCKALAAVLASKRFFTGVRFDVYVKVPLPREPRLTVRTGERFFATMPPEMNDEGALPLEGALTLTAGKWSLVRVHYGVSQQETLGTKHLAAHVALMLSVMSPEMVSKIAVVVQV